jgi:hypothetical protein
VAFVARGREYERPREARRETKVTHDLALYRELAYGV